MAKTEKTKKPPHSWPATANTETAKSSRENVGIKVEFGFYHKRKKKTTTKLLGKLERNISLRTDTRIQNYKCFDSIPVPISSKSRCGSDS